MKVINRCRAGLNRAKVKIDLTVSASGKRQIHKDLGYDASVTFDGTGDVYVEATWANRQTGKAGPFAASHTILIVSLDPKLICDWTATRNKWRQLAVKAIGSESNAAPGVDAVISMAQTLVAALATGIAALGPWGALPAGAVLGLGGIILGAFGDKAPPPPPPTLSEISDAVRSIVRDELDIQSAEEAVTSFMLASQRVQEMAVHTWDQLKGKGGWPLRTELSAHDRADFNRRIESLEGDSDNTRLHWHLEHFKRYPEIAKFGLPAYVCGIMTSLHVKRLHLLNRLLEAEDPARLTVGDLGRFESAALDHSAALEAATGALLAYCEARVNEDGLALYVPEGAEILPDVLRKYTGMPDVAFAREAEQKLGALVAQAHEDRCLLEEDRPTKHLWIDEWRYPMDGAHGGWADLGVEGAFVNEAGLILRDRKTVIPFSAGALGSALPSPCDTGVSIIGLGAMGGHLAVLLSDPSGQPHAWAYWTGDSWTAFLAPVSVLGVDRYWDPKKRKLVRLEKDATSQWQFLPGYRREEEEGPVTGQAPACLGGSSGAPVALDSDHRAYRLKDGKWTRLPFWATHAGPPGLFVGTTEVHGGGFPILREGADSVLRRLPGAARMIGGTYRNPVVIDGLGKVFRLRNQA